MSFESLVELLVIVHHALGLKHEIFNVSEEETRRPRSETLLLEYAVIPRQVDVQGHQEDGQNDRPLQEGQR